MEKASLRTTDVIATSNGNLSCSESILDDGVAMRLNKNDVLEFSNNQTKAVIIGDTLKDISHCIHNLVFTNKSINLIQKEHINDPVELIGTPPYFKGKNIIVEDFSSIPVSEFRHLTANDEDLRTSLHFMIKGFSVKAAHFVDHSLFKVTFTFSLSNISLFHNNFFVEGTGSRPIVYGDQSFFLSLMNKPLQVQYGVNGDIDGDKMLKLHASAQGLGYVEDLMVPVFKNKELIKSLLDIKDYSKLCQLINNGINVSTSFTYEDYRKANLSQDLADFTKNLLRKTVVELCKKDDVKEITEIYNKMICKAIMLKDKDNFTLTKVENKATFILNTKHADVFTMTVCETKNGETYFLRERLDAIALLTHIGESFCLNKDFKHNGLNYSVTFDVPVEQVRKQLRNATMLDRLQANERPDLIIGENEELRLSKILPTVEHDLKLRHSISRSDYSKDRIGGIDIINASCGFVICSKDINIASSVVRNSLFICSMLSVYNDDFDTIADLPKPASTYDVLTKALSDRKERMSGLVVDFELRPKNLHPSEVFSYYKETDNLDVMELIVRIAFCSKEKEKDFEEKLKKGYSVISLSYRNSLDKPMPGKPSMSGMYHNVIMFQALGLELRK